MDPVLYIASLSRGRLAFATIAGVVTIVSALLYFFGNVPDARYTGFAGLFLTLVSLSDYSGTSAGGGGGFGGGGFGGGDGGAGGAGGGHGGGCGPGGGPC